MWINMIDKWGQSQLNGTRGIDADPILFSIIAEIEIICIF